MNEFWNEELPPGYYDDILEKGLKSNRGIQANWHNQTFQKIKSLINFDDFHLDYACGPGTFIGKYDLNNSTGVDISSKQIGFARKKYGHIGNFEVIDQDKILDKGNEYQVITVLGLCEFISDDEILNLLNFLYKITKNGGNVYMTTPNYGGFMLILEKLLNLFGSVNYKNQHINRFTKKRLEKLLKDSHFKTAKVEKFLNISVFFGFINFNFSTKLGGFINSLFNNFFGFLLLAKLQK